MSGKAEPVGRTSHHPGCCAFAVALAGLLALTTPARAQVDTAQAALAKNTLGSQLVLDRPAALPTGTTMGFGASYARLATASGLLAWGAGASWSTATEYSLVDKVRNDDLRLRGFGLIQHGAGRGSFGLRLGLGATAVYESRTRAQGNRANLTGSSLQSTSWYLFPAADLEAVVVLRVWESWGMSVSGGPSLHLVDGSMRAGWRSGLGVIWQH